MARFRATMQGQRGMASRLGSTKSGINVRVNGWNLGVSVYGYVDPDSGQDTFLVFRTGGSHGYKPSSPIITITDESD